MYYTWNVEKQKYGVKRNLISKLQTYQAGKIKEKTLGELENLFNMNPFY